MLQTLEPLPTTRPPRPGITQHTPGARPGAPRWLEPALQAAGMAALLDRDSELLLLAPNDAALQAHLKSQALALNDWLADPALPRQLLLEHLLPSPQLRPHAADGRALATLAGRTIWMRSSGPSQALRLSAGNGVEATADGAPLRCGPLQLMSIDRVLASPQGSLLDLLANDPRHQLLLQALRVSGHDVLLRASGPFTLLAPQDGGWAALSARLGMSLSQLLTEPTLLGAVLELHLIPGRWLSHQLPWGGHLHTANSQALQCSALGLIGCHCQAQPLLPGSDRQVANGVLHRLAEPLLPCRLPPA